MFDDDEYMKKVIFFDKDNQSAKSLFAKECENHTFIKEEKKMYSDRAKQAFELAHNIRKFEIEFFWKCGTYFWAFILGSFTAHFSLVKMFFEKSFSLKDFENLDRLSLVALVVTAFFCFFFCLSWVLVNKGSKFWQENWEAHIDMLEDEFSGKLYKTYLNTNNKEEFSKCLFSFKAYNFSVSKITILGSLAMTVGSALLLLFHLLILSGVKLSEICSLEKHGIIATIFIFIVAMSSVLCLHICCTGSAENMHRKWSQR